jgi:adenosylhomocysteine nucleosidase
MPAATGVAAASRAEARAFLPVPPLDAGPVPIGGGALLAVTGVGDARATAGTRALIDRGAGAVVSFGFAAGLRPGLAAGTLLVPRRVLGRDGTAHLVDDALGAALRACLPALRAHSEGDLVETTSALHAAADKAALHRACGAIAADMESAAIARVAAAARVPFAVLRAVVDPAGRDIPRCARNALADDGRVRIAPVCVGLLRRPWEIRSLAGLARDFAAARDALVVAAACMPRTRG